ncbi:MAG: hypothetical protein ACK559_02750, partial [bacterium]
QLSLSGAKLRLKQHRLCRISLRFACHAHNFRCASEIFLLNRVAEIHFDQNRVRGISGFRLCAPLLRALLKPHRRSFGCGGVSFTKSLRASCRFTNCNR